MRCGPPHTRRAQTDIVPHRIPAPTVFLFLCFFLLHANACRMLLHFFLSIYITYIYMYVFFIKINLKGNKIRLVTSRMRVAFLACTLSLALPRACCSHRRRYPLLLPIFLPNKNQPQRSRRDANPAAKFSSRIPPTAAAASVPLDKVRIDRRLRWSSSCCRLRLILVECFGGFDRW